MYNARFAGRRRNFRGAAAGNDTWTWENYDTPMMYMYCLTGVHVEDQFSQYFHNALEYQTENTRTSR